MRKLRFAIALPLLQLSIAWLLLVWPSEFSPYLGDTRAFCYAINAPIMVLLAPVYYMGPIRGLPRYILGVRSDHLMVLAAVAILWVLVGLGLDHYFRQPAPRQKLLTLRATLVDSILVACGIWLFFSVGMDWILRTDSEGQHSPFDLIDGTIAVAWSLILVIWSGRRLFRAIRQRRSGMANPPLA